MWEASSNSEWNEMNSGTESAGTPAGASSKSASKKPTKKAPQHRCSYCGNAFHREDSKWMPFCSKRCQQIDLGHWLKESYGMPVEGHEEHEFDHEEFEA